MHGQALARRALEIAAAGGHNTLMVGPPGSGKTMMARRVAGILPPLVFDEALEVTVDPFGRGTAARPATASSPTGRFARLITRSRTSRSSAAGRYPRPGEISLAHHGVLFLDEMAEFSRHVLEVLRQPLEEGSRPRSRARRGRSPSPPASC